MSQTQMFYAAEKRTAETNLLFLDLVKEGLTREELTMNIKRRPDVWSRFGNWLQTLPSKEVAA